MYIGEVIKKYRELNSLSTRAFAEKTGLSNGYISQLERVYDYRTNKPISVSYEAMKQIATGMNMSIDDLISILEEQTVVMNRKTKEKTQPESKDKDKILRLFMNFEKIPILGRIPAGTPIEAVEEIVGYLPIKRDKLKYDKTEYFCLEVQGDSMLPTYKSGDIVLFHKTNTAENGEDVAIMINGYDATFKKFYRYNDKVVIQPINPEFKTQEFTPEEVESLPVTILGKAISFTRDI